ncbi:hypothetical protein [Paenibacillus polymyxa]|uniref:hypothetical protein n=1 Tax=Paenibacillus polymyxa TaxID=1406 RepID=UPI002AB4A0C3|nr:hypothetical protein [Paenibacillus polymyxa]MDY8026143.1 hypothetical protein [Paenibacillus polymyxa]
MMLVRGGVDNYDRETSQHIVAYLDILGIAARMKRGYERQKLAMNKLHNLYDFSMNISKEIDMEGYSDIQFKIFSDNIIIVKKLSEQPEKRLLDIKALLFCVSNFQCLEVKDSVGWLVRGGISIGELFIDETMVWGEALLKAYDLESNSAIYPRILLDSNLLPQIGPDEELTEFVRKDFDNLCFLNYLYIQHFGGQFLKNGFQMMLDELNGRYSERVYQKLCWHMNYVNRELDRKDEKKDRKYRLCIESLKEGVTN